MAPQNNRGPGYPPDNSIGKYITYGVAGIAALIAATVVLGSWYTVDQTQRGVLLRNGAYVESVQPGLHWKLPWIETVYKIDMQTHTKTYGADANGGAIMEGYSKDQQPAKLRVSVTLHVAADKVSEIYSRFGGDLEAAITRIITPHVYEQVKVVLGRYTAVSAIQDRGSLNSDSAKAITGAIAYDPVFEIESAQVEDIQFSPEYVKSIEQRMAAEVEVLKLRQNLEREKVQADIAVTQAQGRANSVVAEATAAAQAVTLKGNAEATAIAVRGKALGDNPRLIELTQAERWDGKLPVTMLPGGTLPMLFTLDQVAHDLPRGAA